MTFSVAYFECFDDVLVLEVPDEHVGVATPTNKVAIGMHETATREATSVLRGWVGQMGGANHTTDKERKYCYILVLQPPSNGQYGVEYVCECFYVDEQTYKACELMLCVCDIWCSVEQHSPCEGENSMS